MQGGKVESTGRIRPKPAAGWLLVLALLAGCGAAAAPGAPPASPTPTASVSPTPTSVEVIPAAQGSVCREGRTFSDRTAAGGGWVTPVEGCPHPWVLRAFLSFPLSGIPEGATTHFGELRARRRQVGIPYAVRGQRLLLEAVPWTEAGGLDPQDFDAAPLEGTRAVVAADSDGDEIRADVTDLVRASRRQHRRSADFRLRFQLEPPPPGTSDQWEEILPPVVLRMVYTP